MVLIGAPFLTVSTWCLAVEPRASYTRHPITCAVQREMRAQIDRREAAGPIFAKYFENRGADRLGVFV